MRSVYVNLEEFWTKRSHCRGLDKVIKTQPDLLYKFVSYYIERSYDFDGLLYDRDFDRQMSMIDRQIGADSFTSDFLHTTRRPLQMLCVKPLVYR